MPSIDFPVGSIVYFLATKTEKVLPAQVVERIDRTSLSGIKSTYIITVKSAGSDLKKLEVDPEKINLFKTPEEMKKFMVERATEAISVLVHQAVLSSSIFERSGEPEDKDLDEDLSSMESWHIPAAERPIGSKSKKGTKEQHSESGFAEVDLGNGQKARMKL